MASAPSLRQVRRKGTSSASAITTTVPASAIGSENVTNAIARGSTSSAPSAGEVVRTRGGVTSSGASELASEVWSGVASDEIGASTPPSSWTKIAPTVSQPSDTSARRHPSFRCVLIGEGGPPCPA
jgi:hypothetical protein